MYLIGPHRGNIFPCLFPVVPPLRGSCIARMAMPVQAPRTAPGLTALGLALTARAAHPPGPTEPEALQRRWPTTGAPHIHPKGAPQRNRQGNIIPL